MIELIILISFCIVVALIWQYIQNRYFHRYEILTVPNSRRLFRGTLKQCENELYKYDSKLVCINCIYPSKNKRIRPYDSSLDYMDSGHGYGMNMNGTELKDYL